MTYKVALPSGNLNVECKGFYLQSRKEINSKTNGLGERRIFLMEISKELTIIFVSNVLMILLFSGSILILNF